MWGSTAVQVDVELPHAGAVGELHAHAADAYLAAVFGSSRAVARYLREQEFRGLASYVGRMRGRTAYIAGTEIPQKQRGKGIGTALLRATLTAFDDHGVAHVLLHAAPDPGRMVDLTRYYERQGFVAVGCCYEDMWPVMVLKLR